MAISLKVLTVRLGIQLLRRFATKEKMLQAVETAYLRAKVREEKRHAKAAATARRDRSA